MNRLLFSAVALSAAASFAPAADPDARLFELRTAVAAPGKFSALNARFKDHVVKLYDKHGATNLGYFVPADGKAEKVVYVLAFKDLEARNKTMDAFAADPAWKKVAAESERNGPLVKDVTSTLLVATDYSPTWAAKAEAPNRVFELRTYTATKDKLPDLNDRFRNHTLKLFTKHGMTNVAYWTVANLPQATSNPHKVESTMIYLLGHKTTDAAAKSFAAFRADPAWVKAKGDSEKKAGGSLTVSDGVKSEFLKPTEYSPTK